MSGTWTIRGGRLVQPAPFCLVGIVNVTPDSFFDGGLHHAPEAAVAQGLQLLREGAHLLDIGAESTRPGADSLGATPAAACAEEMARLLPVVTGLRAARPDAVLCADTCHATTARTVLELGVDVINDVSAWGRDPEMLEVLAATQPGYVLMHGGDRGGVPADLPLVLSGHRAGSSGSTLCPDRGSGDIVDQVLRFFTDRLEQLECAGLSADHVVLDPGIGFGKTQAENVALLRGVDRLHALGRPLYVGVSMKSLFGALFGLPLAERGEATRVVTALLATHGVHYHRVHEIAPAVTALTMAGWYVPDTGPCSICGTERRRTQSSLSCRNSLLCAD